MVFQGGISKRKWGWGSKLLWRIIKWITHAWVVRGSWPHPCQAGLWWVRRNASISKETASPYLLWICMFIVPDTCVFCVQGVEGDVLISNNGCMELFLFKFEGVISFLTRTVISVLLFFLKCQKKAYNSLWIIYRAVFSKTHYGFPI